MTATMLDRDALAEQILSEQWAPLYDDMTRLLEILPEKKKLEALAVLRDASDILKRVAPFMCLEPSLKNAADALTAGAVASAADWLERQIAKRGPAPTTSVIAQAAYELAEISKKATGKSDWRWVEKKLREKFGDSVPRTNGSSLRSLAYKAHRWKLAGLRERPPIASPATKNDRKETPPKLDAIDFFAMYEIRRQRAESLAALRQKKSKPKIKRPVILR